MTPPSATIRAYRGGCILHLAHGLYHASFDGVDLGYHSTPAGAEWVIDDHVFYLVDAGLLDTLTPPAITAADIVSALVQQGIPYEIAAAHVRTEFDLSAPVQTVLAA
jgi:hypothetical protein